MTPVRQTYPTIGTSAMIKSGLDFSAKTEPVLLIVPGGTSQEY